MLYASLYQAIVHSPNLGISYTWQNTSNTNVHADKVSVMKVKSNISVVKMVVLKRVQMCAMEEGRGRTGLFSIVTLLYSITPCHV